MRRAAPVGLAVALILGACATRADDGALGLRPTTTRADGPADAATVLTDLGFRRGFRRDFHPPVGAGRARVGLGWRK